MFAAFLNIALIMRRRSHGRLPGFSSIVFPHGVLQRCAGIFLGFGRLCL
jgi:hypothetical protein